MRLKPLLIPGLIVAALAGVSHCAVPDEFAAGVKSEVDALMAAGQAAEKAGRNGDAAEAYYKVLELDPMHDAAFAGVSQIMDNAVLPDAKKRAGEVLKITKPFGGTWRVHQSPHFVIIYNTDDKFARLRGSMLELAHKTYFDQFRKAEQRPLPLRKKLVCILFAERKPFIDFARKVDGNMVPWTSGYYSARNNWTVFYDDKDNPIFDDRKKQIAEYTARIAELEARLKDPKVARNLALTSQIKRDRGKLFQKRRAIETRIKEIRKITNASKTVHEGTHQLSFNTNLMGRRQHYPFWIAEGLATNFEPEGPGQPFGPFIDNPTRRRTLREAAEKRMLLPLNKFVVKMRPDPNANDTQVRADYAHAWGLYSFLHRLRHKQMRQYLANLRTIPNGPRKPETMLKEFADVFGPMHKLQDEFDRWLKRQ